jgi:riboflavin kinase / FMN adenylyltransferase
MRIIHQAGELALGGRSVSVAIGIFDGVHLGHQRILSRTVSDARRHDATSAAITFDRHPNAIVAPDRTPPMIYSLGQRLRGIGALGIETTWLIRFDRAFSEQSGEAFVRDLARESGQIQSICIGRDFTFGHKRTGNVALLKTLGQELGFVINALAPVSCDGKVISSTRIREAIQNGDLQAASQMLGRLYSVAGRVVPGQQLGKQLGFPTANLDVTGLALPPNGVYAGSAQVAGRRYQAVANIGYRPTLQQPEPTICIEVHLLNFCGDIYDQEVEFQFTKRLRAEEKFPSIDALKGQIEKDITAARALLS